MSSSMPARADASVLPLARLLRRACIVVIVAYGAWIVASGPRLSPDSQTYSRWADTLIAMRFNLFTYLREQTFVVPPVFYILWTLVIAVLKSTLGAAWPWGVLFLNWLSIGWGSYVMLDRIRRLTASAAGMLLGMLLLLTAADLLMFAPFVLSDLIFWAISTAVIGLALQLAAGDDERPRVKTVITGTALTLVALAFRPVGIPLLVIWGVAVITAPWPRVLDRFGSLLLAAVSASAIAVVFLHAYLLMHPDRWPGATPPFLTLLSDEYHRGVLVYAPGSDFVVQPATTVPAAARLTLQKLLYFVTPWLPHFSVSHTLLNLIFFVPAYGLSAIAVTTRERLSPAQRRATILLAAYVIALSVFHAMMQIEFDHRYRLPMLPVLIMLSATGLEAARRPEMLAATGRTK
jgi:hypothetical protein